MAHLFDIIVENAMLNAKTAILQEAAGTEIGDRYVYIVEAAGDTLKKAKDFVVNNKGKLAALAGTAALAGAGYAYRDELKDAYDKKFGDKPADKDDFKPASPDDMTKIENNPDKKAELAALNAKQAKGQLSNDEYNKELAKITK